MIATWETSQNLKKETQSGMDILHAWVCLNQIFIILAKLFFENGKLLMFFQVL
jgi:hypothetical protein